MDLGNSQYPLTSFVVLTGGAYALWWLWNKKPKNVDGSCEIPSINTFQSIVKRRSNNIPEVLTDLAGTFGCIYSIDLEPLKVVVANSREMIELVGVARTAGLIGEHSLCASKICEAHSSMHPNEKSIIETGELKEQCRRAIKCYGCEDHLIGANILIEVDKLIEVFRTYESSEGPFDAYEYIHLACTNVLCSLMFGCRYKYKSRRLKAFTDIIRSNLSSKNIFRYAGKESGKVNRGGLPKKKECLPHQSANVVENLKKFLYFISFEVESHKKDFVTTKYRDFVDIYLKSLSDDGKNKSPIPTLSFESTIVDVFTFGAEPVSAHIMWAIYCMVEYPDVQTKCHEEIDEKVGHNRPITLEDRKILVYICATLKEVMRRFTVVPLSMPLVVRRDFKLGPYEIVKNSTIVCNYHAVHMDPDVWQDPGTFSPERFKSFQEDRFCKKLFNFGSSSSHTSCPASCLSTKIAFIIFANLLQNFDFEKDEVAGVRETSRSAYDIVRHPPSFKVKIDSH